MLSPGSCTVARCQHRTFQSRVLSGNREGERSLYRSGGTHTISVQLHNSCSLNCLIAYMETSLLQWHNNCQHKVTVSGPGQGADSPVGAD